jgi:hypothetical protein
MNKIFIVLMMIFCHIVDDYYLQKGLLNCLKQKSWWRAQDNYKELYKYDYIVGLIIHSFSWAFMIMLPIAFVNGFEISATFLIIFIANMIIHAIVDDLKANKFQINLITDQTMHLLQIATTTIILL